MNKDKSSSLNPEADLPRSLRRGAISWMARNSVAANLMMLLFIIGGCMAVPNIKQEVFPEFELDMVSVSVAYPGAGPEEVEQGIILAVEESVRGLDGVKRVTASAAEGRGSVTIELLDGADSNLVLQDIKNAVDRITTFPEDAEKPIVSLLVPRREVLSIIIFGDADEDTLRALGEMAKDDLAQDPDITLVTLGGVKSLEIGIEVPIERLRAHNLTLGRIANELTAATVEVSGGGIKTEGGEVLLRTVERRDFGSGYGEIPVVKRADGTQVLLRDIAAIRDGYADEDLSFTFNGKPAVRLSVYQVGKEDPLSVSRAASRYMDRLRAWLPDGMDAAIIGDRSELYGDRVRLLIKNALQGLILVMLVLGLFLEVRLAFWVMLGIPVSFLGSLLFLPYVDVTINMVSLFGFIVAVGIVVDDAIVVGESVYYQRQQGDSPVTAAIRGTKLIAVPVVFAILTNIIAFLPLLFVPGTTGQIWRNVPLVIITVFLISLVEALFILPAHLARQHERMKGRFWTLLEKPQEVFGRGLERFVEKKYQPFIRMCLHHRYLTLAIALAMLILAIGWMGGGRLGFTFFPRVEGDMARAAAVLPYGVPFADSLEIQNRLVESAMEVVNAHGGPQILRGVLAQVGGDGTLRRSGGMSSSGSHIVNVTVYLTPLNGRKITASQFTQKWREQAGAMPNLESLNFRFTIGPSADTPVDVELSHPDTETLESVARKVAAELRSYSGVIEIEDGISRGKPQLDFRLKPAGRAAGITAAEMARQVRHAFYGAEVRRQQRGRNEVRVMARLPESERRNEDELDSFLIRTPDGGEMALMEAATIERSRAYEEIRRVEGRRVLNVKADIVPGVADAGRVLRSLGEGVMQDLNRDHPSLTYSFEGERRQQRESMGQLQKNFFIALIALFAVLAIPFRSYAQALVIMIAIPFGIIGAVVGHVVMGFGLSIVSIMGMVALSGVVVNDSLLLVDTANRYRAEGMNIEDLCALAPMRRFRPVLLTSLTTFFGLAPIIFEKSMQARFLIPMAISLGFGILFSTTISLILVPALYWIVEDIRGGFRRFVNKHIASD